MAHIHRCKKCQVEVAVCSDESCKDDAEHANAGEHYCSIHHPGEHRVEQPPPPPRYSVLVKESK